MHDQKFNDIFKVMYSEDLDGKVKKWKEDPDLQHHTVDEIVDDIKYEYIDEED